MTNLEKLKLVIGQIQFMIDEKIIDEDSCGSILSEVHDACEILVDANPEYKEDLRSTLVKCTLVEDR